MGTPIFQGPGNRAFLFAFAERERGPEDIHANITRARVKTSEGHRTSHRVAQQYPPSPVAAMTHDTLVDELVSHVPLHRDTRWSAGSLGLDEATFDAIALRLLALEARGAVDVTNLSRDNRHGLSRLNAIRFVRVA